MILGFLRTIRIGFLFSPKCTPVRMWGTFAGNRLKPFGENKRGLMMGNFTTTRILVLLSGWLAAFASGKDRKVDHSYSPANWVSSICLPDDSDKVLVHKDGSLFYDYKSGAPIDAAGFGLTVRGLIDGELKPTGQSEYSGKVPIVQNTYLRPDGVELTVEVFRVAPPRGTFADSTNDIILISAWNGGNAPVWVTPRVVWKGNPNGRKFFSPDGHTATGSDFTFGAVALDPDQTYNVSFGIGGPASPDWPTSWLQAQDIKYQTVDWWNDWQYYGNITLPDGGMQSLLETSIHNIYQARIIDKGLPAFRVGCCVYNGLWVVDGSFILEAVAYTGGALEARAGIEKLMSIQKADGSLYYLADYHKEHGIALWLIGRHAILTGDKTWLTGMWPKVTKLAEFIHSLRLKGNGLMPPGATDGGVGGPFDEFSNDYWNMLGLKYAVKTATWLGKTAEAAAWQSEFNQYWQAFESARLKNMQKDAFGNDYLPIVKGGGGFSPNRGQWAFFHSVFPGDLYPEGSAFVKGQMAMMEATEKEGLPFGSGWNENGVWNYLASFYGHAWLAQGRYDKATNVLYDFANHSSPINSWIEEQALQVDGAGGTVGDMPHNWASAELIRYVRHSLILEREGSLHLFAGLPVEWIKAGGTVQVKSMPTSFGEMSLKLVSGDSCSVLSLEGPTRNPPDTVWIHMDAWKGTKTAIPPDAVGGLRTFQLCKSGITRLAPSGTGSEAGDRMSIRVHAASVTFERAGRHEVEVFTLAGKPVWRIQGIVPARYDLAAALTPGLYLLKVKWNGRNAERKILITAGAH